MDRAPRILTGDAPDISANQCKKPDLEILDSSLILGHESLRHSRDICHFNIAEGGGFLTPDSKHRSSSSYARDSKQNKPLIAKVFALHGQHDYAPHPIDIFLLAKRRLAMGNVKKGPTPQQKFRFSRY
jgi:hypothetical protein